MAIYLVSQYIPASANSEAAWRRLGEVTADEPGQALNKASTTHPRLARWQLAVEPKLSRVIEPTFPIEQLYPRRGAHGNRARNGHHGSEKTAYSRAVGEVDRAAGG